MLHQQRKAPPTSGADLTGKTLYEDTLGPDPVSENPGELVYTTAVGTTFFLYETAFAGQAGDTIAEWHVADVAAEVAELQGQGAGVEHYDLSGITWDGDVASMGEMGKAAWFTDSEGNIMCIDDMALRSAEPQSSSVEECAGCGALRGGRSRPPGSCSRARPPRPSVALEDREPGDPLTTLGERSVGHEQLSPRCATVLRLRRVEQPHAVHEGTLLADVLRTTRPGRAPRPGPRG